MTSISEITLDDVSLNAKEILFSAGADTDELDHVVCCDNLTLCGKFDDSPLHPWDCACPEHENECVVCAELSEQDCPRCGE